MVGLDAIYRSVDYRDSTWMVLQINLYLKEKICSGRVAAVMPGPS